MFLSWNGIENNHFHIGHTESVAHQFVMKKTNKIDMKKRLKIILEACQVFKYNPILEDRELRNDSTELSEQKVNYIYILFCLLVIALLR